MADVKFFQPILIGLIAMTLASGAMAGAMAMRTYAADGVHDVSQPAGSLWLGAVK